MVRLVHNAGGISEASSSNMRASALAPIVVLVRREDIVGHAARGRFAASSSVFREEYVHPPQA
jgi:hypothetical protein